MQINPSDGDGDQTISSGLPVRHNAFGRSAERAISLPMILTGSGSANASICRVSDPGSTSPTTSVYATLPIVSERDISVRSGRDDLCLGVLGWCAADSPNQRHQWSGALPLSACSRGVQLTNLGLLAAGTGEGTFLIANPFVNNATIVGINNVDLTTSPPTYRYFASCKKSGANFMIFGPDGCIYSSQPYGVQNHRHQRRLQLCRRAVVADGGVVADRSVAEPCARNIADVHCHAALFQCARSERR